MSAGGREAEGLQALPLHRFTGFLKIARRYFPRKNSCGDQDDNTMSQGLQAPILYCQAIVVPNRVVLQQGGDVAFVGCPCEVWSNLSKSSREPMVLVAPCG